MTAQLTFRCATEYTPGAIYAVLAQCYADILDAPLQNSLRQFDHEIFASPDTVGACAFISSANEERVGFFSYNPRQGPQVGIIGHNGVLPPFQRRGYGTQQILELLHLFTMRGFACARVTTSQHPFFLPARGMYEKCGFSVSSIVPGGDPSPYGMIHYAKPLIA